MKRFIALLTLLACLAPGLASAHPLGNFTVNHYSRLEPAGDLVRIIYVLDMAEIPSFQEKVRVDPDPERYADQRAEEIRQRLSLTLDGQPAVLRLERRRLTFPEGQGGLPTLRLEVVYSAELPAGAPSPVELSYRDDNDPSRIGWREIVARPGATGTQIQRSSVPAEDTTDELRRYPDDLLNSPLNVREAHLSVSPGSAAGRSSLGQPPAGLAAIDRARSALADLASPTELTPSFVLLAIVVAMLLGAGHALQPGHGKAVLAAYLVGSRGTARHALVLGGTITATHTAGVYTLGLVTLLLSQFVLPERLYPLLGIVSGLLVLGIGVWLFGRRLAAARHSHPHTHPHPHDHDHGHAEVGWRSLLALGVSGGLLPCPEALMVLLITIAAHRVLFGLLVIVAFSTGLAGVLVGFGLLLVYARSVFQRLDLGTHALAGRLLPVASALVIVIAGLAMTAQALPQLS